MEEEESADSFVAGCCFVFSVMYLVRSLPRGHQVYMTSHTNEQTKSQRIIQIRLCWRELFFSSVVWFLFIERVIFFFFVCGGFLMFARGLLQLLHGWLTGRTV